MNGVGRKGERDGDREGGNAGGGGREKGNRVFGGRVGVMRGGKEGRMERKRE